MSAGSLTLRDYVGLVRGNRNFRLLWIAQIVSEMGDWLYAIVIYDMLLQRTGNAASVALAVVVQVLPQVPFSPMAGVINDRLPRRWVMIFADLVRAIVVGLMLVAITLPATWPVYVLLFIETVMWAFFEPGRAALIPNLTSGERETFAANALSSTTWSFNFAIGSALGGLLAVRFGVNAVLVINSLSFLVSAALLLRMRIEEPHTAAQPPMRAADLFDFSPVIEGVRYIKRDPRLVAVILAKAGLGIMGANYVLLTIFGERIFPASGSAMLGMSLLMGARGVGAVLGPSVGALWAGSRPERLRTGILYGFLAGSAGYLALAHAPSIAIGMLCVIFAHAGASVIWVFSTTMLQSLSADRFRGRVFSADYAFNFISLSLSVTIAGLAVDLGVPVRAVSLGVGILILVPAALWLLAALPRWRDDSNA